MSRLKVRHRPDGVIQLNRRRVWEVVVHPAFAVLLALFASFVVVVGALTTAVIEFPDLPEGIALILPCLVLGLWGAQMARSAVAATVPVEDDPPPRSVA
ncbi:hypothetical protein [Anaeromyxobacter oryzae]|uniref:Uncharacterized protein n=1 Tax=Anaeromyxobacter oryzae TaxID=2918170 RepID=A0ABM7WW75_9BACT|nr:hypothetical protein [Anaeromyxobacter oryzae]BDG03759.1 hypothetical protein AMOR_27550 [Anaeromyxobacter oryzae]